MTELDKQMMKPENRKLQQAFTPELTKEELISICARASAEDVKIRFAKVGGYLFIISQRGKMWRDETKPGYWSNLDFELLPVKDAIERILVP